MNFLNQFNTKQVHVLKLMGIGVVAVIVLAFVGRLFGSSFSSLSSPMQRIGYGGGAATAYPATQDYYGKMMGGAADTAAMPELSIRNINPSIAPVPAEPPAGNEAEAYEVKNYRGVIETSRLQDTCGKIVALKAASYVIFENAHQSDHSCDYTFKVERSHVEDVLAYVKALRPKDLSENTQTIKRTIDDFTGEVEILQKKKATIEKTLEDATKAYDEITAVATRAQDANSLANIITSKLQIIERLTQERINISEQLDRLSRAKAEQLDRLEYTYFSLAVYENTYLDGDSLKESWKNALRTFVQDLNKIAQDLSITLVALFFLAVQYVIYFFILLIIVKYVWRTAKYLWKK
jgi:hypothetical protein